MDLPSEFKHLLEALKTERDELRVQLHLLQADAREEWEKLEKQWQHLQHKAGALGTTAAQVGGEIDAAARLLGEEMRDGYRRLRDTLKAK